MNPGDHMIWSDYYLNYEDWQADLEAEYPELSEDQRVALMYERNADYLDDERVNLNIDVGRPILLIANLGLWDGRHQVCHDMNSTNIRDCLVPNNDYTTWYVDQEGDLRCDSIHHDGTNHYLYRACRADVSKERIERLKLKIERGVATREDIEKVTRRLGDEIGKVYGWSFPAPAARIPEQER